MASTYTPNVTAQDALKRHLAEQHVGSSGTSSVATVASATATSLAGLRVAFITGTTQIDSFTGGAVGQIATLRFATDSVTVNSGAPLLMEGGVNFTGGATDTITFLCVDATVGSNVWNEVSRSTANASA